MLHELPDCRLINGYGPTENTTFTACCSLNEVHLPETVPIGKPIANTRIYLLDTTHQLVPPGVVAELCIAGAGLARGYLHRPELTAEKFIEVELFGKTERIYKTGDLARWLPDGNLEFLGRIDHQVKLRGFRIELGEIEAVLSQHEGVKEAVVSLYEADGNKRLVAYLVLSGQWLVNRNKDALLETDASSLSTIHYPLATIHSQLSTFLKSKLPDYMVPAHFVVLDSLPLTPNGKIDRKALPVPDKAGCPQAVYIAPRDPFETLLTDIWQALLQVQRVSVHDNFFELGGHSLLLAQLAARIRVTFHVDVSLRTLFQSPTLELMSLAIFDEMLKQTDADTLNAITKDL